MAICSTYHTVLKASPGAAIFGRDMLFDIPFVADWHKIGEQRQSLTDHGNQRENAKHIDYDYKVRDKVLLINEGILRKAESAYGKEPWTIPTVHTNGTIRIQCGTKWNNFVSGEYNHLQMMFFKLGKYIRHDHTTVPSTIVRGGAPVIFPSGQGIFPMDRGKNLDFSLRSIPTVGRYEKQGKLHSALLHSTSMYLFISKAPSLSSPPPSLMDSSTAGASAATGRTVGGRPVNFSGRQGYPPCHGSSLTAAPSASASESMSASTADSSTCHGSGCSCWSKASRPRDHQLERNHCSLASMVPAIAAASTTTTNTMSATSTSTPKSVTEANASSAAVGHQEIDLSNSSSDSSCGILNDSVSVDLSADDSDSCEIVESGGRKGKLPFVCLSSDIWCLMLEKLIAYNSKENPNTSLHDVAAMMLQSVISERANLINWAGRLDERM
jgi:hypothetical protein